MVFCRKVYILDMRRFIDMISDLNFLWFLVYIILEISMVDFIFDFRYRRYCYNKFEFKKKIYIFLCLKLSIKFIMLVFEVMCVRNYGEFKLFIMLMSFFMFGMCIFL